jgi:hypothetical protein
MTHFVSVHQWLVAEETKKENTFKIKRQFGWFHEGGDA